MKCPKCSLVTFDHLSKCPRCETSFELRRRLTRRRGDLSRRILIRRETDEVQPATDSDAAPPASGPPSTEQPDAADAPERASLPTRAPTGAEPADPAAPNDAPGGPRLSDLAATERETDIEVKVSAAVEAARATLRDEPEPTAAEIEPAGNEPPATTRLAESGDDTESPRELGETQQIKERMKRAGRARRKNRPDYSTETTDPVLPDWYEPDLEAEDESESPASRSTSRR